MGEDERGMTIHDILKLRIDEDTLREVEIFKAKYPWRVKQYERCAKQFMDALTPDTIIGPWKQ